MIGSADRRLFIAGATAAAAGLAGCLPETSATGTLAARAVDPPRAPEITAVTNRRPIKGAWRAPWFGPERQPRPRLAAVKLRRLDGGVAGPIRAAFAGRFAVDEVLPLERPAPEALADAFGGREAVLYVHGYNESFESAVLSAADLFDGIAFGGAQLVFAWPSRAALFDYGYDRESALFSRDALEETLVALLGEGGASRLHIVAHSMGTLLTVETLRQMLARHGDTLLGRLGAVVLASADIDLDLFANSLERLRSIVPRITVISSTSDRALAVSRRLAGGVARAGAAAREELAALGVRVVDASDHGGWGIIRHDLFLSDREVRQVVARALDRGRS